MKIVAGYTPSRLGGAVLAAATDMARSRSAELVVFQHHRVTDDVDAQGAPRSRSELEALVERLQGDGLQCRMAWTVGAHSGAQALLSLARREEPDLIVIGVRRRSPVGKAFLGSDAQEVLLDADCPVLAVKAEGSRSSSA